MGKRHAHILYLLIAFKKKPRKLCNFTSEQIYLNWYPIKGDSVFVHKFSKKLLALVTRPDADGRASGQVCLERPLGLGQTSRETVRQLDSQGLHIMPSLGLYPKEIICSSGGKKFFKKCKPCKWSTRVQWYSRVFYILMMYYLVIKNGFMKI